jgi:hypothetical protein
MPPPAQPKLYHILHVDRLSSVVADGCLWCDAVMIARDGSGTTIGMGSIKARRLALPVHPHPGSSVGDYVPFYFCPRSIMLYVIYRANHPELEYRGGQDPIVHLEADLGEVVEMGEYRSTEMGVYVVQRRSRVCPVSSTTGSARRRELAGRGSSRLPFRRGEGREAGGILGVRVLALELDPPNRRTLAAGCPTGCGGA